MFFCVFGLRLGTEYRSCEFSIKVCRHSVNRVTPENAHLQSKDTVLLGLKIGTALRKNVVQKKIKGKEGIGDQTEVLFLLDLEGCDEVKKLNAF